MNIKQKKNICVVGLGYVGLPLACAFASKGYCVKGYDNNADRIEELNSFKDVTGEVHSNKLKELQSSLQFTNDETCIKDFDIVIISVPTPIKVDNTPDLGPLIEATKKISKHIKIGTVIVYESTVFPGATEEVCVPIIESTSNMRLNSDFFVGYSPERINPGDKLNKLENIKKVISASDKKTLKLLEIVYGDIIDAGLHLAKSIKIAEASKITENIQRDVNIALVNELHQIFNLMGIETEEVIEAASTKWNFMKVFPGLVGGHCIGVDPHYMIYKSTGHGYVPNLMRNAREVNEGMATWAVNNFLQFCQVNAINLNRVSVTIFGYTFKKNCSDTRNTKIDQVISFLDKLNISFSIWDPWIKDKDISILKSRGYDVLISPPQEIEVGFLCVKHDDIVDHVQNLTAPIFDFTQIN